MKKTTKNNGCNPTTAISLIMNKVIRSKENSELFSSLTDAELIDDIMEYILHSDSPVAQASRERIAKEMPNFLEQELYYNTELCVDVKSLLFNDKILEQGKWYQGFFKKDNEGHLTFVEKEKQSIPAFDTFHDGRYVMLTKQYDNTLRAQFKDFEIKQKMNEKQIDRLLKAIIKDLFDAFKRLLVMKPTPNGLPF